VWLRDTGNPERKYPLSWELVEADPGVLVGINTIMANSLVREAIEGGVVGELQGFETIRCEVRYGKEQSRIDLVLEGAPASCYVEVKNVTLVEDGIAFFPDAVTARGVKHLRELAHAARSGHRAVIFFCVQRGDAGEVRPAGAIDPLYAETLRHVMRQGVEALAYAARIDLEGIELAEKLPVRQELN
jgi:sugar fermentation stimulation protein A